MGSFFEGCPRFLLEDWLGSTAAAVMRGLGIEYLNLNFSCVRVGVRRGRVVRKCGV